MNNRPEGGLYAYNIINRYRKRKIWKQAKILHKYDKEALAKD